MAPPVDAEHPQHQRKQRGGGARLLNWTKWTLPFTISFVIMILSLLKLAPIANMSVQYIPDDSPHPLHTDLPDDLRALQELTTGTGKKFKSAETRNCPPPLKLYENRIVAPSHYSTTRHAIPRILHLSERSRCLNRDMYDALQIWQNNFPSFSIFFHDDAAVDRLLLSEEGEYSDWRTSFPDIVKVLPCVAPGAMKIDIWRVLVLWKYGGMYSDVDIVPGVKLTEEALHPHSAWFSLSDAWYRPSQWLFATSAHHMSCKNALHIIAKRLIDVENIQKTKLVFVTGPQALYWGWKDSIRNETEDNMESVNSSISVSAPLPVADHINGTLIIFNDGSWGQWIEGTPTIQWSDNSYWGEMVPFEETKCVQRKTRAQTHFGRVHWVTAQKSGSTGLPTLSCRKHLENLPLKEQDEPGISTNNNPPSLSDEAPFNNSTDLILKNSNNATMCTYLANEIELKKEQVRKNADYCGSCYWIKSNKRGGKSYTCDQRMEYMMSYYKLSPQDAFHYVMEKGGDKCNITTVQTK